MKNGLLIFILAFLVFSSKGQNETSSNNPKNAVFIEFFGPSLVYSLNYERTIGDLDYSRSAIRIGGSFLPKSLITLPIDYLFIYGDYSHHLELGIGYTLWLEYNTDGHYIGEYPDDEYVVDSEFYEASHFLNPIIGYRYHKPEGGFLFKLSFTPPVLYMEDGDIDVGFGVWGGLSFGYTF